MNQTGSLVERPIFLYGTLQALPLLAWALTGDSRNTSTVSPLLMNARLVGGYARFTVLGKDYPALIKHHDSSPVDGLLLFPLTMSQRTKLDDFEGGAYKAARIKAIIAETEEVVDADVYLWNGEPDEVSKDPWDLAAFIKDRLEDWIDIFCGMELVGDEEEQ
ncbi:hypothetical protein BT96DRAFT_1004138 [Gymnopus androsaceus JB14]|uniref:Putative gamma-glutamylcyclotransferase n=1 Tax=Gymnopus androsaceus JB14 TaxID=1447944 RepID=A0A6A4GSW4_9AGAR|nr:hypothetical protein BT96DRAFT_1004138 [Gymnopus androsaceus JB14]